jgi:hypothetical protein
MAQKTGGATETQIKPGDKPKDVAADLTGQPQAAGIDAIIEAEEEAADALLEAAMQLHDIRDDLTGQLEGVEVVDPIHQPLETAIRNVEGSIRELDNAIRRQAKRATTHEEADALGMESSTGVTSLGGPPVSRAITQLAREAKGPSVVPGSALGREPEAKTREEIERAGLTDTQKS